MEPVYQPAPRARLDVADKIKVAAPLVGGLLGAMGGVMLISAKSKAEQRRAQLLIVSWGILTAFGAMAQAVQAISEKQTLQLQTA